MYGSGGKAAAPGGTVWQIPDLNAAGPEDNINQILQLGATSSKGNVWQILELNAAGPEVNV